MSEPASVELSWDFVVSTRFFWFPTVGCFSEEPVQLAVVDIFDLIESFSLLFP